MSGDADDTTPLTPLGTVERQAGALAVRPDGGPLRVVLVTTRRTGRGMIPKGSIDDGLNGPATAVREAWQEAGVLGPALTDAVGSFRTRKIRPPNTWQLEVEVFPVEIREVRENWPEAEQRTRRFVTIDEARELVGEPAILEIAATFARSRPSGDG